jgi:hypothetical protein
MPSEAQAKQLYDQIIAQKINEGFASQPALATANKDAGAFGAWFGTNYASGQKILVEYNYDVMSRLFITKSQ